jgi:hypothetical protein
MLVARSVAIKLLDALDKEQNCKGQICLEK